MRGRTCTVLSIIMLLLTACRIVGEIDVFVERENVIFDFQRMIKEENGENASLVMLNVVRYETLEDPGSIHWSIETKSNVEKNIPIRNNTATVSYGTTPEGIEEIVSAKPLIPGYYGVSGAFFIYKKEEIIKSYQFSNSFIIE